MPAQTWVEPVVLEGSRVRLEPLGGAPPRRPVRRRLRRAASGAGRSWASRTSRACAAGSTPRWPTRRPARSGRSRPSTCATGRAVGSSRYMSIVPEHKRLEIGWTWIGDGVPAERREPRGEAAPADPCVRDARGEPGRVQDPRPNERSRTALAGIGATFEGVFRHHMIMPDGSLRDSAWFSVIAPEWPTVKAHLAGRPGLSERPAADLLIVDGRVFEAFGPRELAPYGSDIGPRPVAAPNAVAIVGGRIAWVGRRTRAGATGEGPRTAVVEAQGRPHHGRLRRRPHPRPERRRGARPRRPLPAPDASTPSRRRSRRTRPRTRTTAWVQGRGWMYVPFPGGLPTREQLDAVVPDRPAFMGCYDGHTGWVEQRGAPRRRHRPRHARPARRRDRPRPDDRRGDRASSRRAPRSCVTRRHPAADRRTTCSPRRAGHRRPCTRLGITVDPGRRDRARRGRALADAARRRLAAPPDTARPPDAPGPLARGRGGATSTSTRRSSATCAAASGWTPGSSRASPTASSRRGRRAMLAPYVDDDSTGRPEWAPDQLDAFVAEARPARLAGRDPRHRRRRGPDGARCLRASRRRRTPARDRRHRVEHVETIDRADIRRFADLGVVASMQPYHADPSPNQIDLWAGNIGPDRASQAWSWRRSARGRRRSRSARTGRSCPFDPFRALNSAVNRQTMEGHPPGGWLPSEKLSLPDALSAYGHGSAYAAHRRGPARDDQGGDGRRSRRARPRYPRGRTLVDHGDQGRAHRRRRRDRPSLGGRRVKGFIIGTIATAHHVRDRVVRPAGDRLRRRHRSACSSCSLIFGVVNGLIKPILKLVSLPLTMMTLGLFGLVINAGAAAADRVAVRPHRDHLHDRRLPARLLGRHDRRRLIGGIAISLVGTVIGMAVRD